MTVHFLYVYSSNMVMLIHYWCACFHCCVISYRLDAFRPQCQRLDELHIGYCIYFCAECNDFFAFPSCTSKGLLPDYLGHRQILSQFYPYSTLTPDYHCPFSFTDPGSVMIHSNCHPCSFTHKQILGQLYSYCHP